MEGCIFCKIIKGEIPSYRIYEDKNIFVFLDINPFAKGHTLVIPKKHSRWLWDVTGTEYTDLMNGVHKIADLLKKAFNTEWVEMVLAGEEVPHTHIHLLPRQEGDGLPPIPTKPIEPKPSEEEMKALADKIKQHL